MKKIFFLILYCTPLLIAAQSISKQVITSLGHNYLNNQYKLTCTTGDVIVGNMLAENGSLHLGNGYLPSLNIKTLSVEQNIVETIKVYPNPIYDVFYINHQVNDILDIDIFDQIGKKIFSTRVTKQQAINISEIPKGAYLINISIADIKIANAFKIIKL